MANIKIKFFKGGYLSVEPTGYPDATCHKATMPYSIRFGGQQKTVETGGDCSVSEVTNEIAQQQQLKSGG